MTKLDFSSLPEHLKASVLNLVAFYDARELFRATKNLRKYYLLFGLFPRKIEKLTIELNPPDRLIGNFSIEFYEHEGFYQVTANEGENLSEQQISNNEDFRKMILHLDPLSPKYQESLLLIISTIRSCETIRIGFDFMVERYDLEESPNVYLNYLFYQKRFLSNLQRLANLEIHDQFFDLFNMFSHYYNPIVDESISFSALTSDDPSEFETPLNQSGLSQCKCYHFENLPLNIESLAETNGQFYTFYWEAGMETDKEDEMIDGFFRKALIPGMNPMATLILVEDLSRFSNPTKYYLEFLSKVKHDHPNLEWIDRKSGQIKPISEFDSVQFHNKGKSRIKLAELDSENETLLRPFLTSKLKWRESDCIIPIFTANEKYLNIFGAIISFWYRGFVLTRTNNIKISSSLNEFHKIRFTF